MRHADRLIRDTLETLDLSGVASVVVLEGGDGALAQEVGQLLPQAKIQSYDKDHRHLQAAGHRAEIEVCEQIVPESGTQADMIFLPIPKGRAYARRLLLAAHQTLNTGGKLFVAGPSARGAKGVIRDAQAVFGNGEVIGYKSHQRVAVFEKTDQPIDTEQRQLRKWWGVDGIMPETRHQFTHTAQSKTLNFETQAGVFSWEHVDQGTALLLEHMKIQPGQAVYDVGCGVGVLGLFAAALGAGKVYLSDVDTAAVKLAQDNARQNQLDDQVEIFAFDNLDVARDDVDMIITNPAFHQGEKVDLAMAQVLAERAHKSLKTGGELWVVANRFLAYHKVMKAIFGDCEKVYEDNAFHILCSKKQ